MTRIMVLLAWMMMAAQAHASVRQNGMPSRDEVPIALSQALSVPSEDANDSVAIPAGEPDAGDIEADRQRIESRITDIQDAIAALQRLVCASATPDFSSQTAVPNDCVASRAGR
ncbi:hypothetical protein [Noviherbaspirillum pedocola]|uniref:Uncharacterized protein n=1 Tax=Noviherbaspirillum pedocola TaxID=2801341 RepID=A0A934SSR0_9BURK|nr:hypothetical protein [Noviherbaspirillum pedocola]MBK4736081.1 hypothetical protein [Noviherbaspirillum pedocola]